MLMCCLSCAKADSCEQADRVEDYCINHEERPMTNADRIRQMTDEELAELWWERVDCVVCPVHRDCKMTGQDCKQLALSWLKQEVDNGDT